MTELQLLQAVRRRLAVEERWDPGRTPMRPDTACIVVAGCDAAEAAGRPRHDWNEGVDAYHRLCCLAGMNPDRFNDTHSHADVVALLDRGIAECLAEQAAAGGIASESRPGVVVDHRAKDSQAHAVAPPAAEPVEVA